jgi:hypothetical protein
VQVEKPMDKGSQFIYHTRRSDATPITMLYEVVRCIRTGDNAFRVGAALVCVLNESGSRASAGRVPGAAARISAAVVT